MSNELVHVDSVQKDIEEFQKLIAVATQSGAYPDLKPTQMLNLMLSARDFGVSPMKAINGAFNIIKGKITMATALMADRIRKAGHSVTVDAWTSEKCVITGKRKDNGDKITFEFTKHDAICAGLWESSTWKKYPKSMLYNRAMSQIARSLFPDVVGNCYSEDEIPDEDTSRRSMEKVAPLSQDSPMTIETPILTGEEMSQEDAVLLLKENLDIEEEKKEFLKEYLEYCKDKLPISLSQAVSKWIGSQERFIECYDKWLEKNILVNK